MQFGNGINNVTACSICFMFNNIYIYIFTIIINDKIIIIIIIYIECRSI